MATGSLFPARHSVDYRHLPAQNHASRDEKHALQRIADQAGRTTGRSRNKSHFVMDTEHDFPGATAVDKRLRLTYGCTMPHDTSSAHAVAARLIEDAPDEKWLRTLVDDLDQRIRSRPLERLLNLWGLSAAQGAQLFGISRQAFMKWLKGGPPADRAEAIAALAAATDLLDHHLKRERIAAVVRRKAPQLSGQSLLGLAAAGEYLKVRSAVESMFDLRRIQP